MPVIAIAGAAIAIGVAVEVGTTLAIIAAVGATIGAVGAITGSKELTIAGGVIGAIGGIGALASSAGIFGAEAASNIASGAAGGIDSEIAQWASYGGGIDSEIAQWSGYGADAAGGMLSGAPTVGAASPAVDTSMDVVNTANGNVAATPDTLSTAATNAAAPDVIPAPVTDTGATAAADPSAGGLINQPTGSVQVPNTQMAGQESINPAGQIIQGDQLPSIAPSATASPTASVQPVTDPLSAPVSAPVTGQNTMGTVKLADGGIPGSLDAAAKAAQQYGSVKADGSIFKDIMDMVKTPGAGYLISGTLQAGMSFLGGATDQLKPAQIEAYKAQAAANTAAANLSRQQLANMAEPLPVAYLGPRPPRQPVTGLINTPPPKQPVTGAPA